MSAYDDLIPGASPTRRRSAYDDLLPGGAPAAAVQPAEDARPAGDDAATSPRVADVARQISEELLAQQPARATMTRRGGVRILPPNPADTGAYEDASGNLYELPGAEWGEVGRSIIPAAGAQIRSALANLRRMSNEENIRGREMVLRPSTEPDSVHEAAYSRILQRARARQQELLEQERAALPGIEADAAAAMQDLSAVTPKDMSTVQKGVFSAGTSAPTTLAALAAGIVTRSPAVAMAIGGGGGGAIQAGSTYGEARERGATHELASSAAGMDALIEGFDALPIGVALAPGSAFLKRVVRTMGVEAATEAAQQTLQDLRSMAMENPDLTLGEVWEDVKVALVAGGLGGAVYGSIGAAANAGRRDVPETHLEDQGAPVEPAVEQAPVAPPAPAVPVSATSTEAPKMDTPSAYEDLVPKGPDVDGRVEPTLDDAVRTAGEEIGGVSHLKGIIEKLQRIYIEQGPDAGRAVLEDMAANAPESSGFSQEVATPGFIDELHAELAKRAGEFKPPANDPDPWEQPPAEVKPPARGIDDAGRKAEEEAAEKKRKADAQRGDFILTGSDRAADANPGQGGLFGLPAEPEITFELGPQERRLVAGKWRAMSGDVVSDWHATREAAEADLRRQLDTVATAKTQRERIERAQATIAEKLRRGENPTFDEWKAAFPQLKQGHTYLRQPDVTPFLKEHFGIGRARVRKTLGRAAGDVVTDSGTRYPIVHFNRLAEVLSTLEEDGQGDMLGMPAGTAVAPTAAAAGATPPARASSAVGKQEARPDAIRAAMRELFGAPISEKHQGHRNLGIYRIKPQTIRLKNRNDIRTAAHEVGHHISEKNRAFRKVMRAHGDELISIMPNAYKQMVAAGKDMPRKLQIEEGFAEFIAGWLTERASLQAKVPGFYKAFEAWLEQNPDYASALQRVADMMGAHEALTAEDKILAKVGAFKPPLGSRIASLVSRDTWDTFAQAVLDKWHPLKVMVEDLMPGMAASKNPYAAARLLAGDAAIIEDWISNFTTPFDYAKRLDSKNYGKPLKAILEPILAGGEQEVNRFKAYLIARRAAELKKVGKENLFTTEEIRAGLALDTQQPHRARLFEAVAADIYAYNDRLLDYAVEGGLLAPEVAAKFKQYANYIPFFREPEGDAKGSGRGDPFKRLRGGTANLRDPIANLIQNTANIVHATNRNAMLQKAVALAKEVPGGGRWIETVPLPQQAHSIATQRILDELQKQGVVIDTTMAENMAAIQTFFTPSGRGDDRTRTIVYKAGGQLKAAQVNDPLLWKALGNIPPLEMGLIGKMLAFPAQTLRAGVVLDPTFMVRNFVRDTLSATVQSKGAFIPVASTAQGIKMMAQQKDAYRLWRAFGGAFADQFRDAEEASAIIQKMAKRGGFDASSIITPTRWLDALKRVGSFTESGSRIGEFAATYKPGDIDSALQAALNAREVSTDFGMRGGSEAIQVLTRITPFMNPAMQGLYKTARVLSTADGKGAAAKAAILGVNMALLSMALALLNSDEDWYQEIEEWEKSTYWHFKAGDNVYRIPKPFEYGTLFGSMPEAIALRAAEKEDGETFKKRMLQALGQVFGFRVIPQVVSILGEPWANKSLFTGRKLVPDRQERLEPGLQANPSTSKVAQVAGEAANVSPAVIDNVVRNVFGTMGVHASTVADLMLEQTGAFPPGRERGWQTWPVLKAFVRDPDNPNTKQQRDFYDALEKYRRAVATVKEYRNRGEDAKADRYAEEKADEISMAKSAEKAAARLAKLRKAVRSIEWSRDMTPAEKREAINEQNEEMQAIAREQTRLYQAAKKSYSRPATEGGR